jgi:hypothetical protein
MKLPAGLARDQMVEQRRAQVADMQIAGGRRGKAGNGHRASCWRLLFHRRGGFVHIGAGGAGWPTGLGGPHGPDAGGFRGAGRAAVAALPEPFREAAAGVGLRVEDFADEMLDEMGIDDPFELTGLYDGIPLTEKSVMDQPDQARHDLAVPPPDPR